MEVKGKATRIQRAAFAQMGIAEEAISAFLEQRVRNQFVFEPETDHPALQTTLFDKYAGHDVERLIQRVLSSKDPDLPYQCPLLEQRLSEAFEHLLGDDPTFAGAAPGSKMHPLFLSAPTGELNAFTVNGTDNSKAIIFEDGLWEGFSILCPLLWMAVTEHHDENIAIVLPEVAPAPPTDRQRAAMGSIYDLSLELALTGRIAGKLYPTVFPFKYEHEIYHGRDLLTGAMTFVAGHEWAHIVGQHYELMRGETERHMPTRKTPDQEEVFARFKFDYERRFPHIGREHFMNFTFFQAMEMEADSLADTMMMNPIFNEVLRTGEISFNSVTRIIGARFPLYFFYIFEWILQASVTGLDGPATALDRDLLMQDLVLRRSHPHPLHRIGYCNHCLNDVVEQLKNRDALLPALRRYHQASGAIFHLIHSTIVDWADSRSQIGGGFNQVAIQWRPLLRQLPWTHDLPELGSVSSFRV